MDIEGFVVELNDDLRLEFQSIVQYVQHVAIVTGAEFMSVVDELKIHLTQELHHATVLSEQVAFLGGIPATTIAAPWERHYRSRQDGGCHLRLQQKPLCDRFAHRKKPP